MKQKATSDAIAHKYIRRCSNLHPEGPAPDPLGDFLMESMKADIFKQMGVESSSDGEAGPTSRLRVGCFD